MKKFLSLIILGTFLFALSSTALAKGPENRERPDKVKVSAEDRELKDDAKEVNSAKDNKDNDKEAKASEKKAERQADKDQREELKQLAQEVRAKHQETVALMKEIQAKRQQLVQMVNGLKEEDDKDTNNTDTSTTDVQTAKIANVINVDVQNIISVMNQVKGLGVKSKGLWGDFNKAKKDKDYAKAKEILNQIADNIDAKNEQLKKISAMLSGAIADLTPAEQG